MGGVGWCCEQCAYCPIYEMVWGQRDVVGEDDSLLGMSVTLSEGGGKGGRRILCHRTPSWSISVGLLANTT